MLFRSCHPTLSGLSPLPCAPWPASLGYSLAPLALYGNGKALARLEWVPLEDTIGDDDDRSTFAEP